MVDMHEHSAGSPITDVDTEDLNPTIQKFRSNVTRLLHVESNTERERSKSREALAHAGKMAAVGRMVASVNHEIKRPLASMRLLAENTCDLIVRGDAQAATENLGMLLRSINQLTDLSRELEAFSRKTPLNKTVIALDQAVANARSVLAPKIKEGRHKLEVQLNVQHAYADLDRLTLALVNLVDNAMDASAGSADKRIVISAEETDGGVTIHVRDHGHGIPEDVMDKLFEAFFTTKPEGKGLGLGLALTSEVIADMHGRLSARSHPDGGAEFSIRLPSAGVLQ
jgi:two-component system, NtrC family, C4-dicarboxylate transport sensor histidine kinase DctB